GDSCGASRGCGGCSRKTDSRGTTVSFVDDGGAAPAARSAARQSGGASSGTAWAPRPGRAPRMRIASSTERVSSTNSRSPSSRRCSMYRRNSSLGSTTQQRLHAVQYLVGNFVLSKERELLLDAVTPEER